MSACSSARTSSSRSASILLIQGSLASFGYRAHAVPAGGVGDPERDLRLPDPRHAAAAARPPAAGGAADDHPALALCARRRDVRRLRARQRARRDQPEALRQCRLLGPDGAELLVRRSARRFRQRRAGARAWSATRRLRIFDRPKPSADDQRAEREDWSRAARQQAVPAGADHSRSPRSSARSLFNYTPLGALG